MVSKNKDPRFSYIRRIAALFVLLATLGMVAFRSKNTNEINNVKSTTDTIINPKKLFDSLERRNFDTMNAVYLLDKKQVSAAEIKNLTADKVESVSSWVETRNGKYTTIIDVTLVDPKRPGSVSLDKANPIYYVDGKEVTEKDLKSIDPNDIQSVDVWKGEKAIQKFGEKGKNGVIDVTTKQAQLGPVKEDGTVKPAVKDSARKENATKLLQALPDKRSDAGILVRKTNGKLVLVAETIIIEDNKDETPRPFNPSKPPIYIVDGKEVIDLKSINPNNIESVTVWKDSAAVKTYGSKGINGVIVVETKKTTKPTSLTP